MNFKQAVDIFMEDIKAEGRIRSANSERSYRYTLWCHAEDVGNRDPRYTNRDDVKRTMRRWPNPNSQRQRRSALVSFYDYCMEEGWRKDNPARQIRRPKTHEPSIYRMTREEVWAFMQAATNERERRVAFIGCCAGLRRAELVGLQGRHFSRPGFIWVSSDIAKLGIERYVAVVEDLEPIVADIVENVGPLEYVIPAQRIHNPGVNTEKVDLDLVPCSPDTISKMVARLGKRAGISAHLTPHLMRHAFGDSISRYAGMKNTQALMGHASIATTEGYVGRPSLDELAVSLRGFTYRPKGTRVLGSGLSAVKPASSDGNGITVGIAVPSPRAESWSLLSDLTFAPGPLVFA